MTKPAGPSQALQSPDPGVEQLVEQVRPYIRQDKVDEAREVIVTYSRQHSGPLPAPETYAGYEAVLPGSAERIIAMAEREQEHRHGTERSIVRHEYVGRYVGQAGAFLALIALLSCVAFCAYIGQPVAAGVLGAVSAIVIGFLKYSSQARETPAEPKPKPQAQGKRRKR